MKKIHFMFAAMLFTVMNAFAAEGDVTYYNGEIDVTMGGMEISKGQAVQVSLKEAADGTFTFLLPDFKIKLGETEIPCGDIDVPGVTMTDDNSDGILDVNGKREDLGLAADQEGTPQIWADVVLSGTNDIATGDMNLGISVLWYPGYPNKEESTPIQVSFLGKKQDSDFYDGKIDVSMAGMEISKGQEVQVSLTKAADGSFTFLLPNFSIKLGDAVIPCGDIEVAGVTMTDENSDGISDVNGTRKDLGLAADEEGNPQIWADVVLAGTNNMSTGEMVLNIDVLWYPAYPNKDESTPITVAFVGKKKDEGARVESVATNGAHVYGMEQALVVSGFNGRVYVYALDGRLVKTFEACENTTVSMESGVYVVSAGQDAVKVVVK